MIFFQGSVEDLLRLPWRWQNHSKICASLERVRACSPLPAGWTSWTGHHAAFGGITDGSWCFGANFQLRCTTAGTEEAAYPRQLRHIIDQAGPCEGRLRHTPVPLSDDLVFAHPWYTDSTRKVLDWNGLLPCDAPLSLVRCKTVFTKTKWTVRGLSAGELGRIFDLPSCLLPALKTWPGSQRDALPFLQVAPAKLLLAFWRHVVLPPGGAGGGIPFFPENRELVVAEANCVSSGLAVDVSLARPALMSVGATTSRSASLAPLLFDANNTATAQDDTITQTKLAQLPMLGDVKATKADDAEVPVFVWDERIWARANFCEAKLANFQLRRGKCPLQALRVGFECKWRSLVRLSFVRFMRQKHGGDWNTQASAEVMADKVAGRDCIRRACMASWWEWTGGSRIFYWRWPARWQKDLRDGFEVYVSGELPRYLRPQRWEKDANMKGQVKKKLEVVRGRGYVEPGPVRSLTNYFWVEKGADDIRMVYDATKSGLNGCLWAPSFALPTVDTLTRAIEGESWMGDLDLGDMFLNFMLHPDIQPYCGIDVRPYCGGPGKKEKTMWERWSRCMMGLMVSPYLCIKAELLANETVNGNRLDAGNSFRWHVVICNLPGDRNYDPCKPRVWRAREDGTMASITVVYVDDLRPAGGSEGDCWCAMHHTGSRLTYLGIQVAARKTRPPSKNPGAWAGTIVEADDEGVAVRVTQEKWEKAKRLLADLRAEVEKGGAVEYKPLEQTRGFFVHVQMTYPAMTPYLKGMHLTLEMWRSGRDRDGWKAKPGRDLGFWCHKTDQWMSWDKLTADGKAKPAVVPQAPRLRADLACLGEMLAASAPPKRYVRTRSVNVAIYGVGDASGSGFGSSFLATTGIHYRHGIWGRDAEGDSSNYRELGNLVQVLEDGEANGMLTQAEVFIFTDNSTAEAVFYKGNSSSRKLFDLALRLRKIEMRGQMKIQFIWIAGTRMISQGTDGLSRGVLTEGVMAQGDMLGFLPLNETALDRMPVLQAWIREWSGVKDLEPLSPTDWFERGHGIQGGYTKADGIWEARESGEKWLLWAPAPAAAEVAIDELLTSRHKRTYINHIVIVPRLMTHEWRKKLQKVCDVVLEIPSGRRSFWPAAMHEPLILGLTLRFVSISPWQLKNSGPVVELAGELRDVWKDNNRDERPILRKLCLSPELLESL